MLNQQLLHPLYRSFVHGRYRVFRRGWGTFYCEDLLTKKQETLKTRDKDEAFRLVAAKNETEDAPAFSLHLARVYWKAGDPAGANRAWQHVMEFRTMVNATITWIEHGCPETNEE
jgi:hypothetical protein